MTRILTFEPTDGVRWALLWNAFHSGGNQIYGLGQRSTDERRREVVITRGLKAISVVIDEKGSRKLSEKGGTLSLDQPAFVLLERYIEAAPMPTELSDDLISLIDWVSTAAKKE
jgi:hypothetical protein